MRDYLKATVSEIKLDPEDFRPFCEISASFKVYAEAQYDGHGPIPTFEDYIDEALVKLKTEILKRM